MLSNLCYFCKYILLIFIITSCVNPNYNRSISSDISIKEALFSGPLNESDLKLIQFGLDFGLFLSKLNYGAALSLKNCFCSTGLLSESAQAQHCSNYKSSDFYEAKYFNSSSEQFDVKLACSEKVNDYFESNKSAWSKYRYWYGIKDRISKNHFLFHKGNFKKKSKSITTPASKIIKNQIVGLTKQEQQTINQFVDKKINTWSQEHLDFIAKQSKYEKIIKKYEDKKSNLTPFELVKKIDKTNFNVYFSERSSALKTKVSTRVNDLLMINPALYFLEDEVVTYDGLADALSEVIHRAKQRVANDEERVNALNETSASDINADKDLEKKIIKNLLNFDSIYFIDHLQTTIIDQGILKRKQYDNSLRKIRAKIKKDELKEVAKEIGAYSVLVACYAPIPATKLASAVILKLLANGCFISGSTYLNLFYHNKNTSIEEKIFKELSSRPDDYFVIHEVNSLLSKDFESKMMKAFIFIDLLPAVPILKTLSRFAKLK